MPKVKEPSATYIIDKKGKKTTIILPIEHNEQLMEDLEDVSAIASRKNDPAVPWDTVKRRLRKSGLLHH
jgi:hypothetical protein